MNEPRFMVEEILSYQIELVVAGDDKAPVMVFAHGLGGNREQWTEQIQFFSRKFRVIAFSLQGHGQSSKPDFDAAYSIEAYGDVAIALLKKLGVDSCIWVGNSMGGVIGYDLIRRNDNIISHLLTNGTAPTLKYGKMTLKLIGIMDRLLIKVLGYQGYINIAVRASLKAADKRVILKRIFMAAHPRAIICSHQLLGDYNFLDVIKNTSARVSFITTPGDKDINKAVNKHKPDLELLDNVTFYDQTSGGHVFNMEDSQAYNNVVNSVLCEK